MTNTAIDILVKNAYWNFGIIHTLSNVIFSDFLTSPPALSRSGMLQALAKRKSITHKWSVWRAPSLLHRDGGDILFTSLFCTSPREHGTWKDGNSNKPVLSDSELRDGVRPIQNPLLNWDDPGEVIQVLSHLKNHSVYCHVIPTRISAIAWSITVNNADKSTKFDLYIL